MTASMRSPLRRFVSDGLHETLHFYTAGTLPLHRFAWELHTRLDNLVELTGLPHWRTLRELRAAQRDIAAINNAQRASGAANLTAAQQHALSMAINALHTGLAQLDSPDPIDPPPALPSPAAASAPTSRRPGHSRQPRVA